MIIFLNTRIFPACLTLCLSVGVGLAQSGADITREMFSSTKKIETLTYKMKKTERIDDTMVIQTSTVKLQRKPFKVYTRQLHPNDGLEVLYLEGSSSALINPNGFPWFNLKLDPQGDRMRKEQHHTIQDAGYDHFVSIVEHLFDKYDEKIHELTKVETATINQRPCWVVEFNNSNFKYIQYKVKNGESITSIANKFKLNGYMILEKNENIKNYNDVTPGQVITIPNDYSPRMILYIDKAIKVPVAMKVYDEKGLYEHYEYSDIKINPKLHPEEFTENYSGYGF